MLTQGKFFEIFILDFGNHKIKVQAECVNSIIIDRFKIENLPYGGFKLAFRFTQVSTKDKAFIADFVMNEILMQQVHKEAN